MGYIGVGFFFYPYKKKGLPLFLTPFFLLLRIPTPPHPVPPPHPTPPVTPLGQKVQSPLPRHKGQSPLPRPGGSITASPARRVNHPLPRLAHCLPPPPCCCCSSSMHACLCLQVCLLSMHACACRCASSHSMSCMPVPAGAPHLTVWVEAPDRA